MWSAKTVRGSHSSTISSQFKMKTRQSGSGLLLQEPLTLEASFARKTVSGALGAAVTC